MVSAAKSDKHTHRVVGLDLGSRSIKLASLVRTPAGIRVVKRVIQDLPASSTVGDAAWIGWLQSVLKEFDTRDVHVSISGPEVAVRRVPMPLMSRAELLEAVKWQIKEQIPFPVQDTELDVQVIGEVWDKDIKKQDVLVGIASRAAVEQMMALIERAGAHVASVVPTEMAAWRCVTHCLAEAGQSSVAVIEMGAATTEISIAKGGHIRLVRDLPVGSASLTEALVGAVASERGEITIDQARAEALKRQYGVLGESSEGATEDGIPLFHVASLMRPVLEHLLTELSRLFDFYKVQMDEAGVSKVLLCGGGATLKALPQFLADGLGVTVEVFNPLLRITERDEPISPEQITEEGPRLAVALGLALNEGREMNLLPAKAKRALAFAAPARLWRRAALGLAAGAGALLVVMGIMLGWTEARIRQQESVWAKLEPAYQRYRDTADTVTRLTDTAQQGHAFIEQQPVWEGVLKEIGALVPATIELTELSVSAKDGSGPWRMQMKGRVAEGAESAEGSVAKFVEALERSVFFAHVELTGSEMHSSDPGKTSFDIEADLE